MKRARIRGALVGVESVTPEGLESRLQELQRRRGGARHPAAGVPPAGVHVLGSFIFGLPTDTTGYLRGHGRSGAARERDVCPVRDAHAVARNRRFCQWERETTDAPTVDGVPLTRYWLIPTAKRPRVYAPHPNMDGGRDSHAHATGVGPLLSAARGLAAIGVCPFAARATGICPDLAALPTDVREHRDCDRQRTCRTVGTTRTMACPGGATVVRGCADARPAGAARADDKRGQALRCRSRSVTW